MAHRVGSYVMIKKVSLSCKLPDAGKNLFVFKPPVQCGFVDIVPFSRGTVIGCFLVSQISDRSTESFIIDHCRADYV